MLLLPSTDEQLIVRRPLEVVMARPERAAERESRSGRSMATVKMRLHAAGDEGMVVEDHKDDERQYQVQARDGQTWWYDKGAIEV